MGMKTFQSRPRSPCFLADSRSAVEIERDLQYNEDIFPPYNELKGLEDVRQGFIIRAVARVEPKEHLPLVLHQEGGRPAPRLPPDGGGTHYGLFSCPAPPLQIESLRRRRNGKCKEAAACDHPPGRTQK